MPSAERSRAALFVDFVWHVALRLGFQLARVWWHIRRPHHEGALVTIYVGRALLLVKTSYRVEWGLPGGSIHPGETPEEAAQREINEEIGLSPHAMVPAGEVTGMCDGRRDRVHFFELHLDSLPDLRLDNREIVAARLVSPEELQSIPLTAPVAVFLRGDRGGLHKEPVERGQSSG
ncbi:NUDIX hydrolase [Paraburkholderia phymatum]|uniref:NUDIX hydrolase n=1 Tax=Paraburkholderia phymatum (strain DSM 17167 / CIP 108236 / LMG 21445 / STM815) TaxID=391038 RepID=B2JT17_PARP8|nr:NUDIX hydrolase [Paraburkholderia phymatum]ACC75720.1 NUDIX hydrolase [Paraburkholderia phymatum STM815]